MYHKKLITYLHFAILLHHEINNVNALKLTPVQQLTQRIDLSSESQSSYLVVSNALKKKQQFMQFLIDDENYTMPSDSTLFSNFKDLLNTAEFQKMQLTIQRWNLIETKLRHAISLGNPGQVNLNILLCIWMTKVTNFIDSSLRRYCPQYCIQQSTFWSCTIADWPRRGYRGTQLFRFVMSCHTELRGIVEKHWYRCKF